MLIAAIRAADEQDMAVTAIGTDNLQIAPRQWFSIAERLPPLNRPVLYKTEYYESAGRLDESGVWRKDRSGRSEALPVLCWSTLA